MRTPSPLSSVDVYVAPIPKNGQIENVYPPLRNAEILACGSKKVQTEKYYVWKLLEYAVCRTFDFPFSQIDFEKCENGKWKCNRFAFSLSHSKNAVAVALSKTPVGVDIEWADDTKIIRLANKILNEAEKNEYEQTPEAEKPSFLLKKWTQKESLFKQSDKLGFFTNIPDTTLEKTWTKAVNVDKERYFLSVAASDVAHVRLFEIEHY